MTAKSRQLVMALLLAILLGGVASAQRAWQNDDARSSETHTAGDFDYYSLVLSWSPTHCSSPEADRDTLQCQRRDGRRYAFILHGLWPQYERGYPEFCRTQRRPFVPQPLIDSMLDIMPSPRLVIHEYRKHGTCSGLDPQGYYDISRQLFNSIRIPERYVNPFETQFVSPATLKAELASVNRNLEPEMIGVVCASGPGNRLREIRICFDKTGQPRSCGANENQGRLCRAAQMTVPPVRSTRSQ